MPPITEITKFLQGTMTKANIKLFSELIAAFFCCRYQTTTRGLSRYTTYSKRQLFRFLKVGHDWRTVRLILFGRLLYKPGKHYIVAVDETVEGKTGKQSFGLGRFYSSVAQKVIKGVCFFGLSIIEVGSGTSYVLDVSQVLYTEGDKERIAANKKKAKEGKERAKGGNALPKGRKKGATGKKPDGNESASYRTFKGMWSATMVALRQWAVGIRITHLVADSAYGTLDYLTLSLLNGCHLISKLARNAALYACAENGGGQGRPPVYGAKFDLSNLNAKYLKNSETDSEGVFHETFQFQAVSKSIKGVKLNVVVLASTRKDGKKSINVWFSNDLALGWHDMLAYYSLRFQIEFDFRDAKQHFGLSDFKNYKEVNLANFVNLSFTMCLVAKIMLAGYRASSKNDKVGILDLKIIFNARHTAKKVIKFLRLPDSNDFYSDLIDHYVPEELINAA